MRQDLPPGMRVERVHGWAEVEYVDCLVARATDLESLRAVLDHCRAKGLGLVPRGGGYTFGDMFTNRDGVVLDTRAMNRVKTWDPATGRLTAEPGVTIGDVLRLGLPAGWVLPACPGGKNVTMAGALGNNVHGKDSWKFGNFVECVQCFTLLLADGSLRRVDREADPAVFHAAAGGMGLLGVVTEITIQLHRPPSVFVAEGAAVSPNIRRTVEIMEAAKADTDLLLAWVDAFPGGDAVGRGYVSRGRWLAPDQAPAWDDARLEAALSETGKVFGRIPAKPFWFVGRPFFRPLFLRQANRLAYFLRRRGGDTAPAGAAMFADHNFVHNKIPELIHVFRPYGLAEFQVLYPGADAGDKLARLLEFCRRLGMCSLLAGTKAHRADASPLSFAGDGYSFSVDLQLRGRNMSRFKEDSARLLDLVVRDGGKCFLAKDRFLTREHFQAMYPEHVQFLKTKAELDPDGLFTSDMYRRLMA